MPKHQVNSYEDLKKILNELKTKADQIFILYTADKDEDAVCPLVKKTDAVTGKTSWCSDCNQALPILDQCIENFLSSNKNAFYITVSVGDKESWKDENNVYRKELNIQTIPTLQNYKTNEKISEFECLDKDLIYRILK